MFAIRQEKLQDFAAVEALVAAAFADAPHSDGSEHHLVARLRKDAAFVPELSLVALQDDAIVGHILFTEARVGSQTVLVLAPLSVHPARQGCGIGQALIAHGHAVARARGYRYSTVLGAQGYYAKSGYLPAHELGVAAPDGIPAEHLFAICLGAQAAPLSGTLVYPTVFFND